MAADRTEPPLVAIACQGGGSHAAFGAGVLDRLLEDHGRRFRLGALSGTSGGAVNASLVWSGLIQGGPDLARTRLKGLWDDLAARDPAEAVQNWWGQFYLNLPFTWEVSPYLWDLGAREDMERLLTKWVKLAAMPKDKARLNDPTLFVGATDIRNGVSVAIRGDGETITKAQRKVHLPNPHFDYSDIIASLAIPPLYKDVKRRGTRFWDGLFSINPPINALTNLEPRPQEIWVIQINPQRSAHAPTTMREITDRRNELSGNLSLNKELDMIETINGIIAKGHLADTHYRPITVRIVGLEDTDANLTLASKFDRSPEFLQRLFDLGRERAPTFWKDETERDVVTRNRMEAPLPAH